MMQRLQMRNKNVFYHQDIIKKVVNKLTCFKNKQSKKETDSPDSGYDLLDFNFEMVALT
jgi:hypothetical protein